MPMDLRHKITDAPSRILIVDDELHNRQLLEVIVKSSAEALLTVINDILDFSRIEASKLELEPIDFNPRDAIGDAANAVAWRAHQKGLELIVDVGAAVPRFLRGDPGRLRQILVNLLGNAIKFTTEGEVVLRATTEATTPTGVVLHVTISDTGIGIPLDRQPRIFDAFTQVDGSTTRTHGGTGLGLTIASQLVELMGGRMWVESEVGRGSAFHFTASLGVAIASPMEAVNPDTVDLQGLPVLVVDGRSHAGPRAPRDPGLRATAERTPAAHRRGLPGARRCVAREQRGFAGDDGSALSSVREPEPLRAPGVLHAARLGMEGEPPGHVRELESPGVV